MFSQIQSRCQACVIVGAADEDAGWASTSGGSKRRHVDSIHESFISFGPKVSSLRRMAEVVLFSGYLEKSSVNTSSGKSSGEKYDRRFFKLTDGMLSWYNSKSDKEPAGFLDINGGSVELDGVMMALSTDERTIMLRASTADELAEWVRKLAMAGCEGGAAASIGDGSSSNPFAGGAWGASAAAPSAAPYGAGKHAHSKYIKEQLRKGEHKNDAELKAIEKQVISTEDAVDAAQIRILRTAVQTRDVGAKTLQQLEEQGVQMKVRACRA